MSALKRDADGNAKRQSRARQPAVTNQYTPIFERFRDELDEHHDRRERIIKNSRDVTALSKKIIFSLQRVREINPSLPDHLQNDVNARLGEISRLLSAIAADTQGINRYRYVRALFGLEELVEALTFAHYLQTQRLIGMDELSQTIENLSKKGAAEVADTTSDGDAAVTDTVGEDASVTAPVIGITETDYLHGVLDLTGEMMRFATVTSALTGSMAASDARTQAEAEADTSTSKPKPAVAKRTIVQDMQDLASFFAMFPTHGTGDRAWTNKMEVLMQSVRKVEKLGYDRTVRGSERPEGWVPDMSGDGDVGDGAFA